MRGIYDIESLYKHINKGSGRKFLSKLLFNRPKQEIKINRVKRNQSTRQYGRSDCAGHSLKRISMETL